jgi:CDP-6-deoxy-D-xylo-4-hexulose-3-dehydrase
MNDLFWIGVYPGLTREMIDYILLKFRSFIEGY